MISQGHLEMPNNFKRYPGLIVLDAKQWPISRMSVFRLSAQVLGLD